MRVLLSGKASKGLLSVRQTIAAKKCIHDLNRAVVMKMSILLNISHDNMAPEQLVSVITQSRNSGSLSEEVERKIKHVVYVSKIKALKELISVLNLSRSDDELSIPPRTPEDLLDALFSATLNLADVEGKYLLTILTNIFNDVL